MVGVPGRSRACLTCKARRIKCDLKQPECGQCTRSSRECVFTKNHIFVHHEGDHKTVYRKSDREKQGAEQKSGSAAPTTVHEGDLIGKSSIAETHGQANSLSVIRPIGTLTALKQQLIAEACDGDMIQSNDQLVPRPWTYTLSAFAGSIHALNAGPLSCYTAWIGRRKRDPYLVEASRRIYIQGLHEVQAAVNDPASALLDETLGACLGLIVYEALECPDQSRTGYSCHVDGCARIVQLRGTSMHQDGVAHDLFRTFRYIGLLRDLEKHKASFLSSHPWMTLPWVNQPKSMHDRLLDLLCMAPEVLGKSDRLGQTPPHLFLPALLELADEVRSSDKRLETFYAELIDSHPGPLFWEEPSRMVTVDDASDSGLSVSSSNDDAVLHFRDLDTARILTLYWAMLALVWSGLTDIYTTVTELMLANMIPGPMIPIVRRSYLERKDWLDPVRKICRSIRYFSSNGMGGMGPILISVPIDVVTDVMKNRTGCEKEYAMAVKAGKEISLKWLQIQQFREAVDNM